MTKLNIHKTDSERAQEEEDRRLRDAELDKKLTEVIASLSDYERCDLGEKIGKLLDLRLNNEYLLSHGLLEGLKASRIGVEDLKKLLNGGKDSVGDLVKLVQLLSGGATSRAEVTVKHEDIEDRLDQLGRITSRN